MAAELEAELATPPFPAPVAYVWQAWFRIRRRKAQGINGYEPIGWGDIDAFMRRARVHLDPFDIELIEAIDDVFLVKQAEQASDRDRQQALRDGLKDIEKR